MLYLSLHRYLPLSHYLVLLFSAVVAVPKVTKAGDNKLGAVEAGINCPSKHFDVWVRPEERIKALWAGDHTHKRLLIKKVLGARVIIL